MSNIEPLIVNFSLFKQNVSVLEILVCVLDSQTQMFAKVNVRNIMWLRYESVYVAKGGWSGKNVSHGKKFSSKPHANRDNTSLIICPFLVKCVGVKEAFKSKKYFTNKLCDLRNNFLWNHWIIRPLLCMLRTS